MKKIDCLKNPKATSFYAFVDIGEAKVGKKNLQFVSL